MRSKDRAQCKAIKTLTLLNYLKETFRIDGKGLTYICSFERGQPNRKPEKFVGVSHLKPENVAAPGHATEISALQMIIAISNTCIDACCLNGASYRRLGDVFVIV